MKAQNSFFSSPSTLPSRSISKVRTRGDAAFARPEVYEALEERGVKYAIRIPANDNLERDIAELLPRPVGRPSQKLLVRQASERGGLQREQRREKENVSEESVGKGSVSPFWKAQGGHTNVFGGAFTVRGTLRLHLGQSSGRLPVRPEVHNGNSG